MADELGFTIELRGDVHVIVWTGAGCRPATEPEVEMWQALRAKVGRLERELATVKKSLTVEPVAYAAFADSGNIRMWCRSAIGMCELFDAHGNKAVPLYTHPADQVAEPDAELVRQCIAQELATWEGDFKGPVHTAMRCLQVRIDAKMATLK